LLLRLPDEHGDLIPPASFLYHAERAGLIEPIDHWVLEQAVRHLHESHAVGHELILSVNISGKTMGEPGLDAHLADLLSRYPIPPESLMLEITETAAIKNIELGGPRKCNAGDARFHGNTDCIAHVFVPSRTSPIGSGRNSAGSITRGGRGTSSGKFA